MSRTPAKITQADVARAIRAAQQTGAASVRILPDGTIWIDLKSAKDGEAPEQKDVAEHEDIVPL